MALNGPPWNVLSSNKAPRVRDHEAAWPRNLYTLELAAPQDNPPKSFGGPEQFALNTEQRDFVHACAFFVGPVKEEGQDGEFLGALYGRFFSRWPTPVTEHYAWIIAKRKERIRLDLQWSYLASPLFRPPIEWDTFLSLSDRDLRWAQDTLLDHEKLTRRATHRRLPKIKRQLIVISDSEDDAEMVGPETLPQPVGLGPNLAGPSRHQDQGPFKRGPRSGFDVDGLVRQWHADAVNEERHARARMEAEARACLEAEDERPPAR
ncbi:hypothetical protein EST38_g13281 [Candolleomyces aberdarensis]|uniref:Uncharacterized protein n=1 Tax=Candolleomyces aberdarensis TaxID=2316362 RepID=A0A4Q2D2L9_9AGAR|nr:hypothetical protein EST38_g13281 [Candolleomyces aberdarensis]